MLSNTFAVNKHTRYTRLRDDTIVTSKNCAYRDSNSDCFFQVRRFASLSIPGRDTDCMSWSVFIRALRSLYSALKSIPLHYQRNHIYVCGIDAQWQVDLADMQGLARQNDGIHYLLRVINVFSKFAWIEPKKNNQRRAWRDSCFPQCTQWTRSAPPAPTSNWQEQKLL